MPAPPSVRPSGPPAREPRSTADVNDARQVEGRLNSKIAELLKEIKAGQADVVSRTRSELDAARASMETALAEYLASAESRLAQHEARIEQRLAGVVERLSEAVSGITRAAEDVRHFASEREFREDTKALAASIEVVRSEVAEATEARGELVKEVEADLEAGNRETRSIGAALTAPAQANIATFAALGGELRDDMARLSKSREVHRADTATTADLAALEEQLEDRVAGQLALAQSQLDSKLMVLDAVVAAVDAAAATLETGLMERLTGVANMAATSALAPVRSDLRSVHAEVAAAQRSIRELRRRVPRFLPPPARDGVATPAPTIGRTRKAPKSGEDEAPLVESVARRLKGTGTRPTTSRDHPAWIGD